MTNENDFKRRRKEEEKEEKEEEEEVRKKTLTHSDAMKEQSCQKNLLE